MGFHEGLGPKSPLFDIKWAKNGALLGGVGPKGPISGVPPPPNRVWLQAWVSQNSNTQQSAPLSKIQYLQI